jgi:threonine dehydrogenase-like Zn-dependent dehydrogenase
MRALVYHGKRDLRCESVPDPQIEHDRDAIIKVSTCAICGSDLHLYNGFVPTMEKGDIMGHEFMGEVVEVGKGNNKLKIGDRVVVPFTICCGECDQCRRENWAACEKSNLRKDLGDKFFGHSSAGMFGYSHITGGYAGGWAEYVRVPYADVSPLKIPNGLSDEQVLFLGDIFTTGWQAAVNCDIQPTDWVGVWGAGPVGQFCIKSAFLLGAEKVFVVDQVPERLALAAQSGAIPINFAEESVLDRINELTAGKGPDKCIDAVGLEADPGRSIDSMFDRVKQAMMLESDRPHVLREVFYVCRPGGIVSIPGVYGGLIDKIPFGAVMNKGLTIRTGQTHVNRYAEDLLNRIGEGEIDPSFVITHRVSLEDGPTMFDPFMKKEDGCIKVVMKAAA